MSAPREGMRLARDAQNLTERMQQGIYTAPAPVGGVQGGAQAVQFQRDFSARDKYDDEMNMKMQLMDKDGMTPFGQVYYDDKVGRWLERKAAASEAANFDAYFNKEFNKNDLASRQWAQKINPKFYSDRENELRQKTEVILKLKGIQLRGPQSEEDLHMLWLIDSGRVQLPENWDQIGPVLTDTSMSERTKKDQERQFQRNLIRFPVFLTEKQRVQNITQNSANRLWGTGTYARNVFPNGEPPEVKNNHPLSTLAGGHTLGGNFTKFLGETKFGKQ